MTSQHMNHKSQGHLEEPKNLFDETEKLKNLEHAPKVDNVDSVLDKRPDHPLVYEPQHPKIMASAQTFDASSCWADYQAHFEAVSDLNQWDLPTRGRVLASQLRGYAQSILVQIPIELRYNYLELVKQLSRRFGPRDRPELYQAKLKNVRRKPKQSLFELEQEVRRLRALAYPKMDSGIVESLSISLPQKMIW